MRLRTDTLIIDRTQSVSIDGAMSASKPLKTGLPQGSLLGPFAFPSYSAPLFDIARQHDVQMHMYADDTQLYLSFKPEEYDQAIKKMEICLSSIRAWMSQNRLKLNDSKTEFMVIGKKGSLKQLPPERTTSIRMGEDKIAASETAKNIGVVLDSNLKMTSQISSVCKSSYMQLHNIGKIRPYLTYDSTSTLVRSLVISKIDNSNSLLYGCPGTALQPLQMVLHCSARLISKKRKYDHITPELINLHWLPIKARIRYKVCVMAYKSLNQLAPLYLQDIVTPYRPGRDSLRSNNKREVSRWKANNKYSGQRAFTFAAHHEWNSLPVKLRKCTSYNTFKSDLKTFLFKDSYNQYLE